jgi:hypothetical protein
MKRVLPSAGTSDTFIAFWHKYHSCGLYILLAGNTDPEIRLIGFRKRNL